MHTYVHTCTHAYMHTYPDKGEENKEVEALPDVCARNLEEIVDSDALEDAALELDELI